MANSLACYDGKAAPPDRAADRATMVVQQVEARGVTDRRVLAAMRKVPRHLFVPPAVQDRAYGDHPLPIGEDQTISQPYVVAYMTEALRLKPHHRALEIGTGSGYQAAVLGELVKEVYTIEIVPSLGRRAAAVLKALGYRNVQVRIGDGYQGWARAAPFDAVMLTAAPPSIPAPLLAQLRVGGVLVAPLGPADSQVLVRMTRHPTGFRTERLLDVRFVPMTGRARERPTQHPGP
ncbi:MAG: protein-L-isoaspartate(D-aspartate) O-methyltransferase [Deltaproteobacteria bacterium]|nr:protein-L-isoaspartate(D-aspartate) O-methyltransferase [Deltaproteobacteria bacterium]